MDTNRIYKTDNIKISILFKMGHTYGYVLLLILLLTIPNISYSESKAKPVTEKKNWPCKGCITIFPKNLAPEDKIPMLVLLHGDEGYPDKILKSWKKACKEQGIILFAPKCPKSEGCKKSWWKWDGDPDWLLDEVDTIIEELPVDIKKLYLAGWSGGATYMTFHIDEFSQKFTALSFVAGGVHPSECPSKNIPVHILVGEKDLMRKYVDPFYEFMENNCKSILYFEMMDNVSHLGTFKKLKKGKAKEIIEWLLSR